MSLVKSTLFATLSQAKPFVRCCSSTPNFSEEFVNRNPRNVEQMLMEKKPNGYWLDARSRTFWNKVTLEMTGRHIHGKVTHHTGKVVVSVSTSEAALHNYLSSSKSTSAVEVVAKVLAKRCFETGISYVFHEPDDKGSQKSKLFLKTLENQGLLLTEPEPTVRKDRNET